MKEFNAMSVRKRRRYASSKGKQRPKFFYYTVGEPLYTYFHLNISSLYTFSNESNLSL